MEQIINYRNDSLIPDLYKADKNLKENLNTLLSGYNKSIGKALWFWEKIKTHNGMQLLNIIDDSQKIDTVCLALLNAFKEPGTINSLYRILQAVFGNTSKIVITEKQGSIDVSVEINSQDNNFYYKWVTQAGIYLQTKTQKYLVFKQTKNLGFYGDFKSFLSLFVQNGVTIGKVDINLAYLSYISENDHKKTKKRRSLWQNKSKL